MLAQVNVVSKLSIDHKRLKKRLACKQKSLYLAQSCSNTVCYRIYLAIRPALETFFLPILARTIVGDPIIFFRIYIETKN